MRWPWRKREPCEPRERWYVQFEEGGHVYTYQRPYSEFRQIMEDRHIGGDDPPFAIWVVRNGERCTVVLREED